jgi:hypothetical protein
VGVFSAPTTHVVPTLPLLSIYRGQSTDLAFLFFVMLPLLLVLPLLLLSLKWRHPGSMSQSLSRCPPDRLQGFERIRVAIPSDLFCRREVVEIGGCEVEGGRLSLMTREVCGMGCEYSEQCWMRLPGKIRGELLKGCRTLERKSRNSRWQSISEPASPQSQCQHFGA